MWRRLILHEIGFLRYKFLTSYFIDGRVFFMIFTFYIVSDDDWVSVHKYRRINSREITSLPETKNVPWAWRVISIIAKNKPHAHRETHCKQWKCTTVYSLAIDVFTEVFTCSKEISTLSSEGSLGPTRVTVHSVLCRTMQWWLEH